MTEENLQILQALGEAWNRKDFENGVVRCFAPEVEFNPGLLPPGEDTHYLGHEGVMDWIRNVNDAWKEVIWEPGQRIDVAGDRVLAIDRWHFEGRDGIQVEEELPTVFTFRDGLIVRVDGFTDKAEALEAAGLSE
jgi:ketosteroid isomerase-like protein